MTESTAKLNAFPVFMRVENRRVVIVGGGDEALAKARLIAQSSAVLRIVAAEPEEALSVWSDANGIELVRAAYTPGHLAGAALVFAATGDEDFDRRVVADARARGIPANAVD